jgi:hypothetical protein
MQKALLSLIALASGMVPLDLSRAETPRDAPVVKPVPDASPAPGAKEAQAGTITELGVTEGQPIDSGFVFLDGRYIEAPYKVSRRGGSVFINETLIRKCSEWPVPWFKEVTEDPGLPAGLTRNSTFEDLRIPGKPPDNWAARKCRWLLAHYPPEEARSRFIEYILQLPFVKKVESRGPEEVLVELHNGRTVDMDLTVRDLTPPTKEQVVREIDRIRKDLQGRLAKGDCYFFFTKGPEISCGKGKAARDLGLMAEILRSGTAKEEKATLLRRMGLLPPGDFGSLDQFLTRFQASDQLDKRIEALVKQTGVKPRRLADLPPLPPDPVPMKPPAAVKGTAVD